LWDPQRLTTLWAFTACYRDSFRDRNISTGIWQAHSPDINPYDILFCGSLQDKV
jgi:hypothetical protein